VKNPEEVLFVAEGSVRYHRARASHFVDRAKWLTIITLVLGSAAFLSIVGGLPAVGSATSILVVMINAYRLVAKPDELARTHQKLCQEWSQLKSEVQTSVAPESTQMKKWVPKANALTSECMEDMKAVKAHVFNETMAALGRDGSPYRLTRFQRLTKHILPHTHSFDEQNLRG
jgi:hypothetical protein